MTLDQILDYSVKILAIIGGVGKLWDWLRGLLDNRKRKLDIEIISAVIRYRTKKNEEKVTYLTRLTLHLRFTNQLGKAITIKEVSIDDPTIKENKFYENILVEEGQTTPLHHWNFELGENIYSINADIVVKYLNKSVRKDLNISYKGVEDMQNIGPQASTQKVNR